MVDALESLVEVDSGFETIVAPSISGRSSSEADWLVPPNGGRTETWNCTISFVGTIVEAGEGLTISMIANEGRAIFAAGNSTRISRGGNRNCGMRQRMIKPRIAAIERIIQR